MAARAMSKRGTKAPVEPQQGDTEPDLTVEEAQVLTAQIKDATESLWDMVKLAYTRRAWAALDYDSWDAYLDGEFGNARLRLPREERGEVIHSLRDAGLSLRAIASATGTGLGTVHRELEVVEDEVIDELVEAELVDDAPAPTVTGRDGRTYNARRERQPRAPKGQTPPHTASTETMLSVERPHLAAPGVFEHADRRVGYGNTDFGACVFMDMIQWYSAGSYDEITPVQARLLAAFLLAAAESADMMNQEGAA